MKLKLLVSFTDGKNAGDEADIEQAEAIRMIEAGFAVPVSTPQIERAVKSAPETRKKRKDRP